jgi:hypothetical protein
VAFTDWCGIEVVAVEPSEAMRAQSYPGRQNRKSTVSGQAVALGGAPAEPGFVSVLA